MESCATAMLRAALPDILENPDLDLTPQMRNLIDLLLKEWKIVEDQIKGLSLELERISAADSAVKWERVSTSKPHLSLCAVHVRQFEGASPLSNLMEVKD